jgi:RHS repeat-associated protein
MEEANMRWRRIVGMRRGITVLLSLLGLLLLLPYSHPREDHVLAKSSGSVFWSPGVVNEILQPGETKVIVLLLSSTIKLAGATLWVVPELQHFVKSLEPASFAKLEAGTTYTVSIKLSIPFKIQPGSYDGTMHLRVGSKTYPEVLKLNLHVIAPPNTQPVANAGPDQTVSVAQTVQLDGSKSSDLDGDALTFHWSFASVPSGSGAALSNGDSMTPTFFVDRPGTYVVELIVNDGKSDSAPHQVTISTENSKPVANAGPNQTVRVTDTASLDGSGSTDVDGDQLSFEWSFKVIPSQSQTFLENPNTFNPTFLVDVPGSYTVQLVVNDGEANSDPGTVVITTDNSPPVADAGPDQKVHSGSQVTLDGSASHDADGDPLTYQWSLTGKPEGSTAALSDPTAVKPSFNIDILGNYVGQLIVRDGKVNSAPDTVVLTGENVRPVAVPGEPRSVYVPDQVTLDGSDSHDADGDPLTYQWSITTRPEGSAALLSDNTAMTPTFSPDVAGSYILQLIVNDGHVDSSPATVAISAEVRMAVVPDVVGMSQGDAGTAIAAAWLSLGTVGQEYSDTVPLGQVVSQNPAAGLLVPQGSPVNLVVSLGPVPVPVPDVGGKTLEEAESAILSAGLTVGHIRNEWSDTVQAGLVIGQNPSAGTSVVQWSSVDLVISLGPVMVTVPNVVGMGKAQAETTINGANLTVGTELQQYSDSVAAGRVISQSPAGGASVAQGTAVDLVISLGPVMVTVPNVVGMGKAQAETTINGANLTVGTELQQYSDSVAAGRVISQSPAGGASVSQGSAVDLAISLGPAGGGLPPDPALIAPPLDRTVATDHYTATRFLYTGPNPIQRGVSEGAIDPRRAAAIRGKIMSGDGAPLSGVTVTVLSHPEYGYTLSRADGIFDLVVNGGGDLTLSYGKQGYLSAQRRVNAPWRDYALAPDVVLIPLDAEVTVVDLTSGADVQVARGSVVADVDGTRQATLLISRGTQAEMVMADGTRQALTSLSVRATEYTVGGNGPKAMPAELPPTSGYTYAVELSADEALASGASDVHFSQPVYFYVENFLGFPVGMAVPSGYYDKARGVWVASENGRVVKVISITNGMANLDLDGDGAADDAAGLAALGVTDAERQQIASLYASGRSLWRIPVNHFTPYDWNWPFGPPPDAKKPQEPEPNDDDSDDDPCKEGGSIIECQNQVLGEVVPITGTPFSLNYRSSRVQGRKAAFSLNIPLSSANIPASLKRIDLKVAVAGRLFNQSFPAQPNQSTSFTWDGKDAFGRTVQGKQPATVRIVYVYDGVYNVPANVQANFALASGIPIPGTATRREVTLWQEHKASLGLFDAQALGNGGWSLNVHHTYDPNDRMLYLGDGSQRGGNYGTMSTIKQIAGGGLSTADGIPATEANLSRVKDVAVGPDGVLYIADGFRVRRVGHDGIITTVAGNGELCSTFPCGDGGPAIEAQINPQSLAVGPDGVLYVLSGSWYYNNVGMIIFKITGDGIIRRVAGKGKCTDWLHGLCDEGMPALDARLYQVWSIALGPDGSLYFCDQYDGVRRIGPDGIIRSVAGNIWLSDGTGSERMVDGIPATQADIGWATDLAFANDGSLYVTDSDGCWYTDPIQGLQGCGDHVHRVGSDGIIWRVAGNGLQGISGDGGPATAAELCDPSFIAVGPDGSLFTADECSGRIRRVGPDGIISTVAGGCTGNSCPWGLATQAQFYSPDSPNADLLDGGLAVGPNGSFYFGVNKQNYSRGIVYQVTSALPGFGFADIVIPSENGKELYFFDASGRHMRTVHAQTNGVLYQFSYDTEGRLTEIRDGDGDATTIQRDATGVATAIVAPFGQRTVLAMDADGHLAKVTNPAGESVQMTYVADGLLQSLTDARGSVYHFTYDSQGRLTNDSDPEGGSKILSRTHGAASYEVALTTAMNRSTKYKVEKLASGGERKQNTFPDGTQATALIGTDGSHKLTLADGLVVDLLLGPDPRFGMQAPLQKSLSFTAPSGLKATLVETQTVTLSNPSNPLSLVTWSETLILNGRSYTSVYNAATRKLTVTSPSGRQSTVMIDVQGRVTREQDANLEPAAYTYDVHGRLATATLGTGTDQRTTSFAYNADGYLANMTDPLGRVTTFNFDAAGRISSLIVPDNRRILFTHDANGNVISLTPPGQPPHLFAHTAVDLLSEYTPPDVQIGPTTTQYSYNQDRQLTRAVRPDGLTVDFGYDAGGRLSTLIHSGGLTVYTYHGTTGKLTGITAPGGNTLAYTYDGSLLTGETWTGAVSGSVGHGYNSDFRISSTTINGGTPVTYQYDGDSLLTKAGDLALTRHGQNGLITGTTLGSVSDTFSYNGFGELTSYSASYSGTEQFKQELGYDGLGRITLIVETVHGTTVPHEYSYDAPGRLATVTKNGTVISTYTYDANGNRLSYTGPGGTAAGVYDDQDRLTRYGDATYAYTANGELQSKTVGSQTTQYHYDVFGNLTNVTLPNGTVIEYVVDGRDRRVGKKVNGTFTSKFLYLNQLKPLAELDGSDAVVSQFVYGMRAVVPDYMVKGGVSYRIISDHLGSPRLVVNTTDGTVVQRMDYDEFGNVMMDTNPGFQPFGFAGGLYDPDTKLVRFGARDYDAETGRWTARDPILFAGNQTNLHIYVENDPLNKTDPTGKAWWNPYNWYKFCKNAYEAYKIGKKMKEAPGPETAAREVMKELVPLPEPLHPWAEGEAQKMNDRIKNWIDQKLPMK